MIDSEVKRRSVGSHGTTQVYPVPDGSLDQGDRQQVAWLYRGILANVIITVIGNARATSSARAHPGAVSTARAHPRGTLVTDE